MGTIKDLLLEDMILICIDSVIKKNNKCSFGNLVKECFTRYPNKFSLNDFPEYPDSLRLDRPLREMRDKGFITGSPVTFYSITNFGLNHLANIKNIKNYQSDSHKDTITRSPALQILDKIVNSIDYVSFQKDKDNFKPNDMKFRSIVGFTLETPVNKINNELKFLIDSSQKMNNPNIGNYLKKYKEFFSIKK